MAGPKKTAKRTYRSSARTRPGVPGALKRLGLRIRALREKHGLTQEWAAERAHLDAKHWQEIEAGRVNVTVASLIGIGRALRVPLAKLFEGV